MPSSCICDNAELYDKTEGRLRHVYEFTVTPLCDRMDGITQLLGFHVIPDKLDREEKNHVLYSEVAANLFANCSICLAVPELCAKCTVYCI